MRGLALDLRVLLLTTVICVAQSAAEVTRGVNLGGWLVCEPWMTPSLFEATSTIDEWSLCAALGKQKCRQTLEDHWSNFYTLDDLKQIKAAGLNAIRIPIGHWAVDVADYEPYVSGQYPYLIRAVQWARDLGLKVMLDLHGAPGSQNGWEETGHVGPVDFGKNQSTIDRSILVLRNLTQEFTKPVYQGIVTNIELLNEPTLDMAPLKQFYTAASPTVNVTGINVTLHDGFFQPHSWANYDPNHNGTNRPAPKMTLDTHQFWAFPPLDKLSEDQIMTSVCEFATILRKPDNGIPPTLVGEWSLSTGITANSTSWTETDVTKRTWFRKLFEAQNAAYTPSGPNQPSIGWYFWSWKTEYDIDAWSYRKGVQMGYIPSNVSDPSTYVFPLLANGCINTTFAYTAPTKVTSLSTSGVTSSAPGKSSASSNSATPNKVSAASAMLPMTWVTTFVTIFLAFFMSVL